MFFLVVFDNWCVAIRRGADAQRAIPAQLDVSNTFLTRSGRSGCRPPSYFDILVNCVLSLFFERGYL